MRQFLEEITGIKDEQGASLSALRMSDAPTIQKRDQERRRAMQIDQVRQEAAKDRVAYESNAPVGSEVDAPDAVDAHDLSSGSGNPAAGEPQGALHTASKGNRKPVDTPAGQQSALYSLRPVAKHEGFASHDTAMSMAHLTAQSTAPHSTWQMKDDQQTSRAGKTSANRVSAVRPRKVAKFMVTKKQSMCFHLARTCSSSSFSMVTRASTNLSSARLPKSSTYIRYYDQPAENHTNAPKSFGVHVDSNADAAFGLDTATNQGAVALLMISRMEDRSDSQVRNSQMRDAQVRDLLLKTLDSMASDAEREHYVRLPDHRGVTALHLAVAYGYPATCSLLLDNKARHRAKTLQGESVAAFAKPAENAAGLDDLKLYYRIMLCRDRVRYGLRPPTPASHRHAPKLEERPSKRRMISISPATRPGHRRQPFAAPTSSLAGRVLTKLTHRNKPVSVADGETTAVNTPRQSMEQDWTSSAFGMSMPYPMADQQRGFLPVVQPYTDSPTSINGPDNWPQPIEGSSFGDPAHPTALASQQPPWQPYNVSEPSPANMTGNLWATNACDPTYVPDRITGVTDDSARPTILVDNTQPGLNVHGVATSMSPGFDDTISMPFNPDNRPLDVQSHQPDQQPPFNQSDAFVTPQGAAGYPPPSFDMPDLFKQTGQSFDPSGWSGGGVQDTSHPAVQRGTHDPQNMSFNADGISVSQPSIPYEQVGQLFGLHPLGHPGLPELVTGNDFTAMMADSTANLLAQPLFQQSGIPQNVDTASVAQQLPPQYFNDRTLPAQRNYTLPEQALHQSSPAFTMRNLIHSPIPLTSDSRPSTATSAIAAAAPERIWHDCPHGRPRSVR